MTSIHVRVQHHPARQHGLPQLLHHLPSSVQVVEHSSSPPDPWAGYRQCLTDLPDTSHVLIVQDDALPVPGFWDAVERLAEAQPDRPVCLWMSAIPADAAIRAYKAHGKQSLIPLGTSPFVPLVCVLWPTWQARAFLEWSEKVPRLMTKADDGNVARWMRTERIEFLVAVPSIVEHDDWVPSVKGGQMGATNGASKIRVALLLAEDASTITW